MSRLEGDPVPARVLTGDFDDDFVPHGDGRTIREERIGIHWWRITALEAIPADRDPRLVLHFPYLSRAEIWRPGDLLPLRRALMGQDADLAHSARAFFVPLPRGLERGQHVDIRLHTPTPIAIEVSVEPAVQSHRQDLAYASWRAAVLVTMMVLAVLAFGFWGGVGERAYLYLMIALLCQVLYLATLGGDLRVFPELAERLAGDPRAGRVFGFLALVTSNGFLAHFMELRQHQPRVLRSLHICNGLALLLAALAVFSVSRYVALAGNLVILASVLLVLFASVSGSLRGQRSARFVLVSWLPLMALVTMRVLQVLGVWAGPYWLAYAYPAGFAIAGLVVTIGLSDKMQELRRDRDQASQMASYDALTGTSSRPVIEDLLRTSVDEAHKSGMPLSLVFFDIDHFKLINDTHGHRVGDECIRIVALRVRNRLRTYDQIGRYGGDEMMVLLPCTGLKEAIGVAENMRSAVNCRPIAAEDAVVDVTLSLGVAELQPGETPEQLLERADAALYASKSAGRDRVIGHIRPMFSGRGARA
ncbi:sensor domain-containing diguanylate cyclase [Marilutibacter chinensis]|uniref:diguanylate cyclase n=1 Tax=Marilutibacter chinensis TaxID=2912247 RepID=A0ABS9HRM9_9GAMM|nr:GGDEF domain-containing protein [Lysobacter chinensis]